MKGVKRLKKNVGPEKRSETLAAQRQMYMTVWKIPRGGSSRALEKKGGYKLEKFIVKGGDLWRNESQNESETS